jgi:nicotinamide-nucleotide amidase
MNNTKQLSALQESVQPFLETIRNYCKENHQTIAVAESVTSGCLQLVLSTAEAASEFFQGGITVYNSAQKAIHLHIDPLTAENCNGVDEQLTAQLAINVCTMFRAHIGVAITGYATKAPDMGITELYAYLAIVRNGEVLHKNKITPISEGIEAQWEYAAVAVEALSGVCK